MTLAPTSITSCVTKIRCEPGASVDTIATWLIDTLMTGAQFSGFWSGEIIAPPNPEQPEWTLVQRFSTETDSKKWEESEQYQTRMKSFQSGAESGVKISTALVVGGDGGGITTAIVTDVRPGMEAEYAKWEVRIQNAQARCPGYQGSYIQPPSDAKNHQWTTLLRFSTSESLEHWFFSEERTRLLAEAHEFVKSTDYKRLSTSFPGWVESDASGRSPANWKTALLVLFGLFPVVRIEIHLLNPLLKTWTPEVAIMFSLILSVLWVTFVAMPIAVRAFRWWLLPTKEEYAIKSALGLVVLLCFLLLEIWVFHQLLINR